MKRRRITKAARRFIQRDIRRLARKGYKGKQRVRVAFAQARRKGYKVPRRRRNVPMRQSESIAWNQIVGYAEQLRKASRGGAVAKGEAQRIAYQLAGVASEMLEQLSRGVHVNPNPSLAIIGANPRGGKLIGHVMEIRYQHAGKDRGYYYHKFHSRPTLVGCPDGSLHISGGR